MIKAVAPKSADILVLGGGPAGLTAALAMAQCGFSVICVEPNPPTAQSRDAMAMRTAAVLLPSIALLREIGVWDEVEPIATPLRTMTVIDGDAAGPQKTVPFQSKEIDQSDFGSTIAVEALRTALMARIRSPSVPSGVTVIESTARDIIRRDDDAITIMENGDLIKTALIIAADGRKSPAREQAGITVRTTRYNQTAITFLVTHDQAHNGESIEIYRTGGPFTFVPHHKIGDRDCSAVVWMESHAKANALMALSIDEFSQAATARSMNARGPLQLASERRCWPMQSMLADRFHAKRLALIAETAHIVPPIGAQGLNMSLKDVVALRQSICNAREAGKDIGSVEVLEHYTRRRWPDVAARVAGASLLNVAAIGAVRPLRDLRLGTLSAIHNIAPLRRFAMKFGLGG
jgi:2-octaprenyl-6-methoxyphenol hydroxylase